MDFCLVVIGLGGVEALALPAEVEVVAPSYSLEEPSIQVAVAVRSYRVRMEVAVERQVGPVASRHRVCRRPAA